MTASGTDRKGKEAKRIDDARTLAGNAGMAGECYLRAEQSRRRQDSVWRLGGRELRCIVLSIAFSDMAHGRDMLSTVTAFALA